ncbi:MAG: mRNA 3'-end processing factor [Thermofilum sp. ex4484_15]|nr:MAG: mRNA 3'-end processing factor [Thermofilum sp. ex4484_15]
MKIKVTVLGGGREVGRNAILLEADKGRVLLDYGVSISGEEPSFPLHVRPKALNAVLLSHAHLDHSGAIPLLYISEDRPLVTNELTLRISQILLMDFLKISKYYIPYEAVEVERMLRSVSLIDYDDKGDFEGIEVEAFYAGHIPGSLAFKISIGGAKVFYTGDFNLIGTCTLRPAKFNLSDVDLVITEATYALYDHPPREATEEEFVNAVREVLAEGGTVLVPAFAVGRAQEVVCVLKKYGVTDEYPVYLDGMARQVARVMLDYPNHLRDAKLFEEAISDTVTVKDWKDRRNALRKPCVIVSPAGMLKGGAAVFYAERLVKRRGGGIFFVSYQAPDSVGRQVLENGSFPLVNKEVKVSSRVKWFDLSSHSGKRELREFARTIPKRAKVIVIHCNEEGGLKFKEFLEEELSLETYVPKVGDNLTIEL